MTDVPDGSGQVPRRAPRVSDGGSPVSGGLAILLSVIAVVAGFLILRSISDSGTTTADFPDPGASTAGADGGDAAVGASSVPDNTGPTLPTTTTMPPLVTEGAIVIVANANGLSGSAGAMTRALELAGFEMAEPTDASSTIEELEESVIYYDTAEPNAQIVADSLAVVVGGVATVSPLPDGTPPTADGTMGGADVLFMLGLDKANKTLEELAPDVVTGGNVVTVTNPDPTGTTTTVASG